MSQRGISVVLGLTLVKSISSPKCPNNTFNRNLWSNSGYETRGRSDEYTRPLHYVVTLRTFCKEHGTSH